MRVFIVTGLWCVLSMSATAHSAEPRCACESPSGVPASSSRLAWRMEPSPLPFAEPQVVDRSPFQIAVPGTLLNRLLTEDRFDAGPVRDVIAQTDVVGEQRTVARVQVQLVPNDRHAEFHLVLKGLVQSDTLGVTRDGAVNTRGLHSVVAVKPVMFDGQRITTRMAKVGVDVHNEHVAAFTRYDGLPFFDEIARRTAFKKAERLRPQADAETADSLVARIGPEFNRDADRRLAQFNKAWWNLWGSDAKTLWPEQLSLRTTDSELLVSAAWPDAPLVPAGSLGLRPPGNDSETITVRVHESVLTSLLQRLPLAGKDVPESQLHNVYETFVKNFGGQVVEAKNHQHTPPAATEPHLRFADKDPVRVKIEEGRLLLIINAGVEIAGQSVLSPDEITVPLTPTVVRGTWRWQPGPMTFAKGDQGLSLVGVMESLARKQLAEAIPETVMPATLRWPGLEAMPASLRLVKSEASSGWLTLSLSADPVNRAAQPMPQPREPDYIPQDDLPRIETRRMLPARSSGYSRVPSSSSRSWAGISPSTSRRTIRAQDPAGWFE